MIDRFASLLLPNILIVKTFDKENKEATLFKHDEQTVNESFQNTDECIRYVAPVQEISCNLVGDVNKLPALLRRFVLVLC